VFSFFFLFLNAGISFSLYFFLRTFHKTDLMMHLYWWNMSYEGGDETAPVSYLQINVLPFYLHQAQQLQMHYM